MITPKQMVIRLENLKAVTKHKIMGSALYAAAKPIEDAQKKILSAKTTKRTGNLDKSIGRVRVSIRKANELGTVRIGPRRGGVYRGFHGHLIEFGTKDRYTKKGKYTGRGPSLPFVAPSYNEKMGESRAILGKELYRVINRWAKTGKIVEA